MNKVKGTFFNIFCILLVMVLIGLIGLEIILLIMYGGKPIDEIPTWVGWFLFR